LVAYIPLAVGKVAVRIGQDPEEAEADEVSGNFFTGLGVTIARGRGFTPEDETSHSTVAVLSYAYWAARFGRSPSAVGQTIYVKGVPFTVVGVAAPGFLGLEAGQSTDLWIPLQNRPELNAWSGPYSFASLYGTPTWWCIPLIGRLAPGVTEAQALAKLDPVFQSAALIGLGTPDPKNPKPALAFASAKGIAGVREDYGQPIEILMAMVGLVLVIACANVAMLLVARNTARQREFALRQALGAGDGRLLRQLLTESLLLVSAGALLGWFFAISASQALAAWSGMEVPFTLDTTVLLFTLGVSMVCAIVFGLAPLRTVTSVPAGFGVKSANAAAHRDRRSSWAGKLVVATQMALCLILLVGAGLLVRSLRNYETLPLGFRTDGLLVFGTSPTGAQTDQEKLQFYQMLLSRLRAVPGVESATLLENRLGSGWSNNGIWTIDGAQPQGSFAEVGMRANYVGPNYCHTLGIPVLRGRDLADADGPTAPHAVIVNETFAKRFFPKGDPLGHTIGGDADQGNHYTVVGVAGNSKYTGVDEKPRPMLFFSYAQQKSISDMQVELHTTGDPEALIPSVRGVLRELDPNLPMQKPMTQRAVFEASFAEARLFARLAIFFGLLAALLVATGLYGTLAYRVSRRTSEIGVRMALGAQRSAVLWMILGESLLVTAAGLGVGLPLAIGGAQWMRSMLFGVVPGDVFSFVCAFFGVVVVALVASMIPAHRAASVDPIVALRYE
jgi:predicted permease